MQYEFMEPVALQDIFCSGLGKIEDIGGGCRRLYWFAMKKRGDEIEKELVAELIVPAAELLDVAMQIFAMLGASVSTLLDEPRCTVKH